MGLFGILLGGACTYIAIKHLAKKDEERPAAPTFRYIDRDGVPVNTTTSGLYRLTRVETTEKESAVH